MSKELNLVEILKDCPSGMKLWSPCWGVMTYMHIDWEEYQAWKDSKVDDLVDIYPIVVKWVEEELSFAINGKYIDGGDVMLFPSKDNRDWSTFRIPFKDGDFIYTECNSGNEWISIYKFRSEEGLHLTYANFNKNDEIIGINNIGGLCEDNEIKNQRLASEAEIEQILKALHTIGYNWNNEAKKFEDIEEYKPKWNPDTLKSFDKVLIRDEDSEYWGGDFYLYTDKETGSDFTYSCVTSNYKICIPYNEDTKHLLGTNKEQPVFYRL